ncbi:cytochrome P450 [Terricaulis silvestris]|uniref:Cytochrome P450 n=1 Tax=Terricaulis silvestris TaxID=2686094 RepID=A0A6I6MM05_9CAUL|nr:cytochrome P450 [Terricaulis silvestris]QGZ93747.1 Putative cytochrome P450 [Terricaulis silvestris]
MDDKTAHRDLDHHSAEFARDHREIYRDARARCPVLHSDAHGGFHVLTRFADVRAALRNSAALSAGRFRDEEGNLQGGVAIPPNGMRIGIIEMDPPEGTALRALLRPWFSRSAVEARTDRIAELARWVIDGVIAHGRCDAVTDIAMPMPLLLVMDILGLPLDRALNYGSAVLEAVAKKPGSLKGMHWLVADLNDTIERGGYHGAGLVAALLRAEIDGERLPRDLVVELVMMLLFGGGDTTISAICSLMLHLSRNPADRAGLIEDESLLPRAIEEILRLHSPSTGVARTVVEPVEIAGVAFSPGDRVICAVNSANLDEATFKDADRFDLNRPSNPHLSFGSGLHACLGQNLARADIRVLMTEILRRMPDFEIDLDAVEPYGSIPMVYGFNAMPMRFSSGKPSAPTRPAEPVLTTPRFVPAD